MLRLLLACRKKVQDEADGCELCVLKFVCDHKKRCCDLLCLSVVVVGGFFF